LPALCFSVMYIYYFCMLCLANISPGFVACMYACMHVCVTSHFACSSKCLLILLQPLSLMNVVIYEIDVLMWDTRWMVSTIVLYNQRLLLLYRITEYYLIKLFLSRLLCLLFWAITQNLDVHFIMIYSSVPGCYHCIYMLHRQCIHS